MRNPRAGGGSISLTECAILKAKIQEIASGRRSAPLSHGPEIGGDRASHGAGPREPEDKARNMASMSRPATELRCLGCRRPCEPRLRGGRGRSLRIGVSDDIEVLSVEVAFPLPSGDRLSGQVVAILASWRRAKS
jgi:hypothetical protein